MIFDKGIEVAIIAEWIGADIIGDGTIMATGINEIHKVQPGDITFVDVEKYFERSLKSEATIIILNQAVACPPGKVLLVCDKPFMAYEHITRRMRPPETWDESTRTDQDIHPAAIIEPGVMLGNHVRIGEGSYIQSGVVIRDFVHIGRDVVIQSGAVLGTDAFYMKKQDDTYASWTTVGRVIIEDHVQIGAGCTVNRGVSGDTIIGEGTKMDCQVQIGHGVVIGKNCLIAAQVGIAGKTIVGDRCVLYGQVGIAQNLMIADDVTIYAKSGVADDIPEKGAYFGIPAIDARERFKELVVLRQLAGKWHALKSLLR